MRTMNEESVKSEGNTGDHTEGLKQLDEKALEDTNLVNSVEARLANLGQLTKDLDEVDDDDSTSTPDVPEDGPAEDSGQAVADDDSDDSSVVDDNKDGKVATVSIPDAFVRAAVHQGWTQEDVDKLIKADPELALKTLTNTYNSTVNANREWSALGRAKIDNERALAEAAIPQAQPDFTATEIQKLRTDYGDDPVVARLITNAEKQTTQPRATQQPQPADLYRTATAHANATANASTDQMVNTFFSSGDMSPYSEFYGKVGMSQSIGDLTHGQQEHRLAVLEHAEQIMVGMRMRGMNPTVNQALEKAHLIVTEPIREQVIRNDIKKSVVARKKTLRPANSKKSGSISQNANYKPRDRQELVSKVGANLANVFGSQS